MSVSRRGLSVAALAGFGIALAGCGEKEEITSSPTPPPTERRQAPNESSVAPKPRRDPAPPGDRPERRGSGSPDGPKAGASERSPEDGPGGAGDEIAARSQAMITGRRGRLSPRLVRVPPYIAIRVELRSADGRAYRLTGAGKTMRAGGSRPARAATFDGLRPGRRLTMRGTGGRVVVEASAEPGP